MYIQFISKIKDYQRFWSLGNTVKDFKGRVNGAVTHVNSPSINNL